MMHMGLETAVLAACAADSKLASAADSLLTALAPALAEVRRRSTTAILHLDQLAVRAQRKGSATERAAARAEALIRAGPRRSSGRSSYRRADADITDPLAARPGEERGFQSDDADCPIYVGKFTNLLGRLGSHIIDKRDQIRRVTLLRCKTARQTGHTPERPWRLDRTGRLRSHAANPSTLRLSATVTAVPTTPSCYLCSRAAPPTGNRNPPTLHAAP